MSNESEIKSNPFLDLIGVGLVVATIIALVVMLGVVGVNLVGGTGPEKPIEVAEVAPAPAPTPGGDGGAPAAAEEEPAVEVAAIDPAVMELGKAKYVTCAGCHGPDGAGMKAGPMLMAPSLIGSDLVLGDPDLGLLILHKGIQKEGMDYMGMMAALGASLSDEEMAAVTTYVRNSWGNSASVVTVEQAKAAREKFASVDAPMGVKRAELQAVVDAAK